MNAQQNAPISDRFSSLCARVFSPAAAILESEKTLGTRLHFTLSQLFYTKEHARDNSTWRPARKMNLVSDFATISPINFTPVTVK